MDKTQYLTTHKYLLYLLGSIAAGSVILISTHAFFLHAFNKLDNEIEKHEIHMEVGEIILKQTNIFEKSFYRLATMSHGEKRKALLSKTEKITSVIQQAFDVLRHGGVLRINRHLNLPGINEIQHELTSSPITDNTQRLNITNLEAQISVVENRMDDLVKLLDLRTEIGATNNAAQYKSHIKKIKLFLKLSSAYFVRLNENTNQIYYHETQFLNKLKADVLRKKRIYYWSEIILVMLTLCFVTSCAVIIAGHITKAHKNLLQAKEKADADNRIKAQFLANMSHEIRTPMNGILGITKLVLDMDVGSEPKKLLVNVLYSAESLLGVLNDILDFSKIEAGQLTLEQHNFNLVAMLDNIVSSFNFQALDKNIFLKNKTHKSSIPEYIIADELRLKQVMINLIGNAIKFTEKGGVTVEVKSVKHSKKIVTICFSVIDTGIGVDSDKQKIIFESFTQDDTSTARKFGGTGLGLAISEQLVEMMGGAIKIESNKGDGSRFYFSVDVLRGEKKDAPAADFPIQKPGSRRLNVLLVEDNQINQKLTTFILEKEKHQVKIAENGLEALKILCDDNFDIILMDMQMPEMDGLTATEIIRNCEKGRKDSQKITAEAEDSLMERLSGSHIPIIAMTANAMESDRQKCMDVGMNAFLTKPFKSKDLHKILNKFSKFNRP